LGIKWTAGGRLKDAFKSFPGLDLLVQARKGWFSNRGLTNVKPLIDKMFYTFPAHSH
jgi:hypothetical protein